VGAFEYFATAFVTLLVVVEPFGLAPIFLAATRALAPQERGSVGLRASGMAFLILTGAALIGERLLSTLGISLAAFRIAGGLLLFSIASEMVFGLRIARDARDAEQALEENADDPAAFPLAIPLMAGPGPSRRRFCWRGAPRATRSCSDCSSGPLRPWPCSALAYFGWPIASRQLSALRGRWCWQSSSACCLPLSRCSSSLMACARFSTPSRRRA